MTETGLPCGSRLRTGSDLVIGGAADESAAVAPFQMLCSTICRKSIFEGVVGGAAAPPYSIRGL